MARPGFTLHPKFLRLVHVLGEPPPHVLGYLEFLWSIGYREGNPLIGDAVDVELAAQYPGKKGVLCAALLEVHLIDEVESGKFQIHDLLDHAPEYVKSRARMRRYRGRVRKGESASDYHVPTELRGDTQPLRNGYYSPSPAQPSCSERFEKNKNNTLSPGVGGAGEGSSSNGPTKSEIGGPIQGHAVDYLSADFDRFWKVYPRKEAELAARKAWDALAPDKELAATIAAAVVKQNQAQPRKPRFWLTPDKWLEGRRWLDEIAGEPPEESLEVRLERQRQARQARQAQGETVSLAEVAKRFEARKHGPSN